MPGMRYLQALCAVLGVTLANTATGDTLPVPIPPEHETIRLQGEEAAAGFVIHAPAEAERLTLVADLSLSPELDEAGSSVRFLGNGEEYGRVTPADIERRSVRVRFSIDRADLRPGANQIRIVSSLEPDGIRSIEATYALYAEVKIVSVRLDGGPATQTEMALALLASGPGAGPLYLLAPEPAANPRTMQQWIRAIQGYAHLQRGAPPRIHITDPASFPTTPGHRLIIATRASLQRRNQGGVFDGLPLETGGPVVDNNGFVTWVITGPTRQAVQAELASFLERLPDAAQRLPRPQPGSAFTLDPWLADLTEQRSRLQRRAVNFLLPYDYQPERDPDGARLELAIRADTTVQTRIQVAVNGRFTAERTLPAGRGSTPTRLRIPLPWDSYAAGLNRLTLRVTTPEPAADDRGAAVDWVEPVRLYIPRSKERRITPRIAAALTAAPNESRPSLQLFAQPDQRATREALLTVLANLASVTGETLNATFRGDEARRTNRRAIVMGTAEQLSLDSIIMPGLTRTTLMRGLDPMADVARRNRDRSIARRVGRQSGWPARIARDSQLIRSGSDLMSPTRITDWAELPDAIGFAIEDSVPAAMNGDRRDVFYLIAPSAQMLPAIAASLTQQDLAGFNHGASLLNTTEGWRDFAYTVAGSNAGRSATGTELTLLTRLGRYPLHIIVPGLIALIAALALLGNRALRQGRNHRA